MSCTILGKEYLRQWATIRRTDIPEEDHIETGGTDRLAELGHSLVLKSSVRQSDGFQSLAVICKKANSIKPTFG
ncbi:hypothetical protein AYI68_g7689 [Smittium mucronatum]|nr:hypothetical protein AYI68_g7689 [Smittium mucronatum]